ncbi:AbgT family transporter [Nocardiopsis trehalosi]|jgi:aminobenzoyl-glutamate transport protein|uniref:AbgT family transporter n=1 Tax=Nocardiopsis trehalosi TaxID=109329 RepID=UPI00082C4538|nr:AbgT family transporter [Nocardiopsis trehalosi]
MSTPSVQATRPRLGDRLLDAIERAGNRLPDPFSLFLILFGAVAALSSVMAALGLSVTLPGEDAATPIKGFFSAEGVTWLTTTMVDNFIGFPPLGVVLTMLLAVGIAQRTGLLTALVRRAFGNAPRWLLPYVVAFTALCAHIMSDASMIVVPPLAALVFKAAGRHPVAGLLGAYATATAAFSCTPFVTSTDALLAGISNAAADPVADMTTHVTPVSNLFVSLSCAALLTLGAGLLIDKVLEPRIARLGISRDEAADDTGAAVPAMSTELTTAERSGLRWAGSALLVTVAAVLALTLPAGAPMRNEDGAFLPESPLLSSVVFLVFLVLVVPAVAYGVRVRTITGSESVSRMMGDSVKDMAGFLVVAFVLSQFLALFNWSGMSSWIAVQGASLLERAHFTGYGAIVAFIVAVSLLNFLVTSGSSLWTLIAAVFVPMFALIGYEPGFIQAAFRVGDSATQALTPLNPYLVIILGYLRKYEPGAGIGTIVARMLPFSVVFWVLWVGVLTVFFFTGAPIGPGMGIRL